MTEVTQILSRIEQGDSAAAGQLLPLVYDELRKLAAARLIQEKPGQTLQATALVHDAYLRLVDVERAQRWASRGHFFAAAAEAMRRILVENARRKQRIKHGGEMQQVDLELSSLTASLPDEELIALDEGLKKLRLEQPEAARLIELRFFAGLSNEQAAEHLGIGEATAKRRWRYARAWLHRELRPEERQSD